MWRARFGRGFGTVVKQNTKWMDESLDHVRNFHPLIKDYLSVSDFQCLEWELRMWRIKHVEKGTGVFESTFTKHGCGIMVDLCIWTVCFVPINNIVSELQLLFLQRQRARPDLRFSLLSEYLRGLLVFWEKIPKKAWRWRWITELCEGFNWTFECETMYISDTRLLYIYM
jgi:hypothetical protein